MDKPTIEIDTFPTSMGQLELYFLGHGSLMLSLNGKFIHVDPFSRVADYAALPKAEIILLTHEHHDHLDLEALKHVRMEKTTVFLTELCAQQVQCGIVLKNGGTTSIDGIQVQAVPAYNRVHLRENGQPFHPRGHGNGYVLTFGDLRVYVAGDTEDIPEMKALKDIHIAFLPMNLPYTMTPEMTAEAARSFMPKILYPYHYGSTNAQALADLLAGSGIEVRIRRMA
ncbi:MAG: MBL fold metallo-hydrolase [Chloroflexi bacterium]|nr:MBL fold metallo-hydrolase [Chloroflexota bacterium]